MCFYVYNWTQQVDSWSSLIISGALADPGVCALKNISNALKNVSSANCAASVSFAFSTMAMVWGVSVSHIIVWGRDLIYTPPPVALLSSPSLGVSEVVCNCVSKKREFRWSKLCNIIMTCQRLELTVIQHTIELGRMTICLMMCGD